VEKKYFENSFMEDRLKLAMEIVKASKNRKNS